MSFALRSAFLLIACGLLAAAPTAAQYVPEDAHVFVGEPASVTLPLAADTLVVTYRPSSSIARTVRLPAATKLMMWTPEEAGVVALATPGGPSQNVSVRFEQLPMSGLFVLFGAGLVLFGGAAFAFRKLFEEDDPPAAV